MGDVKSKDFLMDYFNDVDELVKVIKQYKSLHKVLKSEKCLADILR